MKTASRKTKRTVAIVLALGLVGAIALFAATVGLGQPGIPDGDVAVVDGVDDGAVSQDDFDRGLEQAAAQLGLEEVPPTDDPQYASLLDQAMQELLLAIWVEGEAGDRGITVSQEEIDAELERIKEESFADEAEFQQFVERSQFTDEDVNNQVKLTLLRDQLEATIVPEKPEIADDEVEDFYEANIESFEQPASRDVRVVLNSSEGKVDEAKASLEADDSDANWQKVAAEFSQDQASKDRGGLLEGLVAGQGDPQLEEQAFTAAEGELVGPFSTDRGFYLVQVVGVTEASTQPLEEAQATIKQQLASSRQQQIAADFQTDFVDKWTQRTVCDEVATVQLCSNFTPPEAEPVEGQPVPPPVVSTQPIEPGTSTITIDGSAQQGLPQGPQGPPVDPAAATGAPAGAVPIGPGGAATAPPAGTAPPATGAAPTAPPPTTPPPTAP